jgi:hypothetical protein
VVNLANFGETYTNNIRIHGVNYTVSLIWISQGYNESHRIMFVDCV